MKRRRIWIAALVLAAHGAAGAETSKLAPLDPVRTVHVGTVNQASDAGLYVALEKGYFTELGLNVDLVTFTNAANMIAPLGGGQLDVGGGAVSAGLWNADLRKIGIRAVADKGSTRAGWSYFSLVAKKDGPIRRCEDLRGKAISNASLSNGVLHSIELWLSKCGLSLADVDIKTLGYPEVVPALLNGGIAAGHLGEPLVSLNLNKDLIRVLARQDEMRPVDQVALLYFSEQFRADQEAARRFMVAYERGIQDYLAAYANGAPPADWFIDVMVKHTGVKDRSIFATVTPAGLDPWGRIDLAALRSDFEWFKARRLIASQDAAFEGPIDTSYAEYAKQYLLALAKP
ncbi:MAG TPA: ABC transporter substrate-binding protein [Xanthobacteraceae bacterium]